MVKWLKWIGVVIAAIVGLIWMSDATLIERFGIVLIALLAYSTYLILKAIERVEARLTRLIERHPM